ncbi:MAG: HlyD family efflux transporter periplasmic adaptor subunit [Planctomycetota bacterium]
MSDGHQTSGREIREETWQQVSSRRSTRFLLRFALMLCGSALFGQSATATADGVEVQQCVVEFSQQIEVPATQAGRVASVQVRLNDAITANQTLARLDDQQAQIQRRAAQLRVASAKSEAEDEVSERYAIKALEEAREELSMGQSAQQDVTGVIPLTQLRRMRLAVDRAELEVSLARKQRSQAGIDLALREADLSLINKRIEELSIASPIDGVVLALPRQPGEWVQAGQPVATVARIDRLHVHALVTSDTLGPHECQDARVRLSWTDTSGKGNAGKPTTETIVGKILSVDPQLLPGGEYRVHAEVINQQRSDSPGVWKLLPGMEVQMRIESSGRVATTRERQARR